MDDAMKMRIAQRLKALGKTASAASLEADMGKDFIRDMMRKNANPGAEALSRLAETLKTTSEYLLYGNTSPPTFDVAVLPVVGVIEAGQFRDITLADQDEEYPTVNVVKDSRFPGARQYALRVSGDSMDLLYPSGVFVICAEWGDTGLSIRPNMVLHVERMIAGTHLVETTLKIVEVKNGTRYLAPRSSNPKHKPIAITGDDQTELKVRGVVVGSYRPEDIPLEL